MYLTDRVDKSLGIFLEEAADCIVRILTGEDPDHGGARAGRTRDYCGPGTQYNVTGHHQAS